MLGKESRIVFLILTLEKNVNLQILDINTPNIWLTACVCEIYF